MCALVCIDAGTQNLEVYPNTLLIIQTHVEKNELGVESNRRSWLGVLAQASLKQRIDKAMCMKIIGV